MREPKNKKYPNILPCSVMLLTDGSSSGTIIRKGCDIDTLFLALSNREKFKESSTEELRQNIAIELVNNGFLGASQVSLPVLQTIIHDQNKKAGWWDSPREKGTLLCLIHSEISEAMEGERKDLMDDHLPHRKMAEVELADAIIRILDYAGAFDYDIAGAIQEKLEYNKHRSDHKAENRSEENGKKF